MASIDDLRREIEREVRAYATLVDGTVEQAAQAAGKMAVQELKATSPKSPRGGDYAKSWTMRKINGRIVVGNAKHYRLTHLLERGHATLDGGRTLPQPHIKPVEDKVIDYFEELVRRGLS